MVELEDDGHGTEALLEVTNLLERVSELDYGRLVEHPVRVHDELAVLQTVEIRSDQEEVGCGLNLCEVKVDVCQLTIAETSKVNGKEGLTGKKRERGTLIPCAPLKCLMAAPIAVSS
jgi:hypothetical protein